jgi:hypothetical protein
MRYQQVYDATLFTNVGPDLIYITTLTFFPERISNKPVFDWTVPKMQVNLSTTLKNSQDLSVVFSENVGSDDTIVFGPGSYDFFGSRLLLLFSRPFLYSRLQGNLLLDVRILDGSGPLDPINPDPGLDGFNSTTDEVSRVWSTNVAGLAASGSDSIGLDTVIQFSPIPSLTSQFYSVYEGTQTNVIVISWPSQPTTFTLQAADQPGLGASWRPWTESPIFGGSGIGTSWIELKASSAGSARFFRLVWPDGQRQARPRFSQQTSQPSNETSR